MSATGIISATNSWSMADDNLSSYNHLGISALDFSVSELDDGVSGDGFDFGLSAAGGNVDLTISSGATTANSRFDVVIADDGVTSVTFDVDFDLFAFSTNPDAAPAAENALVFIRWLDGSNIIGDLTFTDTLLTPTDPVYNGPSGAANLTGLNSGANFTLDPNTAQSGQNSRAGVFSLDGTAAPSHGGFTLTVTPEDGGTFDAGTSFFVTFDSGFAPVPEPSSLFLTAFAPLLLIFRRRRH